MLQELLEELAFRQKPAARTLMAKVLARLQEIAPPEKAVEDEKDVEPAIERRYDGPALEPTGSSPSEKAPERHIPPGRSELFGLETETYGPMPDDRQRPERLSKIRPTGTSGLPDSNVRSMRRDIALDVPASAGGNWGRS